MKDEELAKDYVKKEGFRVGMFGELDNITSSEANKEIEQAFLAGLKAGRLRRHKVADGDLPTTVGRRFLVFNKYCTMIGYWNGKTFVSADEDTTEIASPIEWCELPTFDKE